MDHPKTRDLARYALGEITDDAELALLEDHFVECEDCRRRAVAVDMIGTAPEVDEKLLLHIAARNAAEMAMCGQEGSRNLISEVLLPGLDASLVCPACLAALRRGSAHHVN
jgi:hypothetical protein